MNVIGIDLGGMSAKAACLKDGKLTPKVRVETSVADSPEQTAFRLAELARDAAARAGIPFSEISAIGVGSPGVVESREGVVSLWSNFGWENVRLAAMIGRDAGKPVFVLNDANAAALGEAKYGAGVKYSDCVLVTIGTGIGSGILIGGKLFEGYGCAGAELGHTVIRAGGEKCTCGRRGCFERYASATALIKMTVRAMRSHRDSVLWCFAKKTSEADGTTAFRAAEAGDETARGVLERYFGYLADGIANLMNLLRPQAVILGGGISAEGEALLSPLREKVGERLYLPPSRVPFELLAASLGNDAGIYGAAHYAIGRME